MTPLRRRLSRADVLDAEPCWLLTVYWMGRVFRFAEFPLTLSSDDGDLPFVGGLDMAEFNDALPRSGVVQDGGEASVSVVFPVNVTAQYLGRKPLENASCELAFILHRGGVPSVTWEGRYVQLVGVAQNPQFGRPDRDVGWAAFTVSSKVSDSGAPVLDPGWRVGANTWTDHNDDDGDGITGAAYPLVIGSPGDSTRPGSPAYLVDDTGALANRQFFLSVGAVDAATVVLWDDAGVRDNSADVHQVRDGRGVLCSYANGVSNVNFNGSGGRHWVGWAAGGGGLRNPYGSGVLERGGDVVRFLIDRAGTGTEPGAWRALDPVLNRFTFAGYVNDPTITAWQLLRDEVLSLLPIKVRIGAEGAYPVNLLPTLTPGELPPMVVSDQTGLEQTSPLEVTRRAADIINDFSISYGYNARENRYSTELLVTPDQTIADRYRLVSAQSSGNIHGIKKGAAIEAGYVDDADTARQILRWKMLEQGFLSMSVIIAARPSWGWLHVGDQVALTISRLSITAHRAIIVSKVWDRARGCWRFEVSLTLTSADHNL